LCIVTRDLAKAEKGDDEIGAICGLAQVLSAAGNDVTLLWAPWRTEVSDAELSRKRHHYSYYHLINLEVLVSAERLMPQLWTVESQSLALFHYLRERQFDAVIVQLEGGLAYYSLLAIETGVFANAPPIIVAAHAPMEWSGEADRFFLGGIGQVTTAFMERYCAENSPHLVCSSAELLDWMKGKGWRVAKTAQALASLVPWEWRAGRDWSPPKKATRIDELVLLATPKFREGITLFCDAIDQLAKSGVTNLTVTAFGPFGRILGEHTGGMLVRRARRWPFSLKLSPAMPFRDRIEYASRPGRLAIVPSLSSATGDWVSECVDSGVPFVSTSAGANAQFVLEKDRGRVLSSVQPSTLAALITQALPGAQPVRPGKAIDARRRAWVDLVSSAVRTSGKRKSVAAKPSRHPLVSIVMAHYNRPQYLPQAIAAIEAQTYPNIEVIIVDDGSTQLAAVDMLQRLEPTFEERGWRILRQTNKYLGAARNTGIKASSGEFVLFVDDDNALFPEAVETFVRAMEKSNADICTAFQMLFYEEFIPESRRDGLIQYLTLGHCLDLGFLHDVFGDANAMVRRSVFDKIGFQNETYGFIAQDWEFFTRAVISGLKLRLIPEPLYWYRSSTEGMYRTSHWYDTRKEIIEVFRKHDFKGLDHLYHMVLAQNVGPSEMDGYRENLRYSVSDERYLKLCDLDPNSQEAIELLARIAATEGRPDTALMLLSRIELSNFQNEVRETLQAESASARALMDIGTGLVTQTKLGVPLLKEFTVRSTNGHEPIFYVEEPDKLFLGPSGAETLVTVLPAGCPPGTVYATAQISLASPISSPVDVLLLWAPQHLDPIAVALEQRKEPTEGTSGWVTLTHDWEKKQLTARRSIPEAHATNLIVAVRPSVSGDGRDTVVCLEDLCIGQKLGADILVKPRSGPPPFRQRSRALSESELKQAKLLTEYKSDRPLLLFAPQGGGIFLRPSKSGPVAAALKWLFPPFARRVVAKVEIAHDDAAAFEFALALSRPDQKIDWSSDFRAQTVAFSGWKRVDKKFTLTDVEVEIGARMKTPLTINLLVRLPPDAKPSPSNSYFRQLILVWND